MTIRFLDLVERTKTGEKIEEREYEFRIFNKVNELVKEVGLRYNPENPVPQDDSLADEVFEAAMRLAVEVGGYCLDTHRVFKLTEEEIKEELRALPEVVECGTGKDARRIFARKIGDRRPIFLSGGVGTPVDEKMAVTLVEACARMSGVDSIIGFNFHSIEGREISGLPMEVWANRREVKWLREGVQRAGKPGLSVTDYPISTKCATIASVLDPDHIRTSDCVMTTPLPELFKIDYDTLTANHLAHEYRCHIHTGCTSFVGGFAGGFEGAAITCLAKCIMNHAVLKASKSFLNPTYMMQPQLMAIPELRWSTNLATQAAVRNAKFKLWNAACTSSGTGEEQNLIEQAYIQIGSIASGASVAGLGRPMRPKRLNLVNPLQIEWSLELSKGAVKMSREEANAFIKEIELPRERLTQETPGWSFEELYDVTTLTPKKEYVEKYKRVHKKFEDLGFPFE